MGPTAEEILLLTPAGPWTPSCISEPIYKVSGAQGLCSYERRSPASFESGRAAGDPQLQGCICGGKRGHLCVLVFLGLCAVSRAACMTGCMRGGCICLGTIQTSFPFHRDGAFLPCGSCKQPNKQTNKHSHMGIQTPYYHHIADAAWFGLYFSRCHSNGKPGSKSEYPLWCSTPPHGKTNDSVESLVCLPYLSFPTPTQQRPSEDLSYACQTPRRSQAPIRGDEGTPPLL